MTSAHLPRGTAGFAFAVLSACGGAAGDRPQGDPGKPLVSREVAPPLAASPAAPGGDEIILTYQYGSQIVASTLTIRASGAVERKERACCPPASRPVDAAPLDAETLAALRREIAEVAAAGHQTSMREGGCMGCSTGRLAVFHDGAEHVVRQMAAGGNRSLLVDHSTAPAAARLQARVHDLVQVDMPL